MWLKLENDRCAAVALHGIAALLKKDVENYGEEDVLIILTRCHLRKKGHSHAMKGQGEGKMTLAKNTPPGILR